MGLFSSDSADSEDSEERAAALAEAATGNIRKKHLTKDSGIVFTYLYDGPLINHLQDGEQPEYIISHPERGYRITEPDGNERTPHHPVIGRSGKRYLLVTDQRLLYVAGCRDGDETIECTYSDIRNIKLAGGLGMYDLEYQTTDGKTYKFPVTAAEQTKQTVDAAIKYVSSRTTGAKSDSTVDYIERQISSSTTATSSSSAPSGSPSVSLTGDSTTSILQQMESIKFEQLVAKVWEKQGWTTEVTRGSRDKGIDIIAVREDPFEQRQYIQAKRYADGNRVGSDAIQKYSGLYARNESVDAVVVVTTSGFTTEAQQVAENRNVKLVDGTKLSGLVEQHILS